MSNQDFKIGDFAIIDCEDNPGVHMFCDWGRPSQEGGRAVSNNYIKLDKAPVWCIQYPTCSACEIDLFTDGDGWICDSCGTAWGMNANDGDPGELYAEWSGEKPGGPPASLGRAWHWGAYIKQLLDHHSFPDIVGAPRRPTDEELMGR